MPLTVHLKPGEKLIVNGVVMQNGQHSAKLIIHNDAALLRQKDILSEQDANTPAARVYFAIQCQYLFPDKSVIYLPLIHRFLKEFGEAAPSSLPIIQKIAEEIRGGQLYQALKSAKQLIAKEQEILNGSTRPAIHEDSASRQPGAQ